MKKSSNSLRTRLFLWYLASLIILALFFYTAVHIFMVPYNTELFFGLLYLLAIIGFFTIRQITGSLTSLSHQIRHISTHNLDTHIKGIQTDDEIGEVAQSFNELLDRLNKAFKRERQFIADVAHELKTPLATLRSSIEVVLTKERTKDEYKKALQDALQETNHLSSTLKNVLDLAWSETPSEQKSVSQLNLSELMKELSEITQKMATYKNIQIKDNIADNIYILGFKDKLARALLNIVDNAINYTQSGSITLGLKQQGDKAHIIIKDTGQGITEADIPYIFDRFYRGNKTDKIFGSGLGLAIAKSVINLHHGTIHVESTPRKGTIFTIFLPISKSS
jgi:signal transduction histidine kinase